jgi:hypothetical protein
MAPSELILRRGSKLERGIAKTYRRAGFGASTTVDALLDDDMDLSLL